MMRVDHTLICGDALTGLKAMPDGLVNCCVTSPPYWGLRDYGLPPSVWGGDASCDHLWGDWCESHDIREDVTIGKTRTTERFYGDESRRFDGNHQKHSAGAFCSLCGAWRGCLGLEPTPALYVEHMVEVFREVRRVLRKDGTLWLNLGDCYARDPSKGEKFRNGKGHRWSGQNPNGMTGPEIPDDQKPKDLVGIPWRVAFALQADGWWLRSDIIWSKPNPMPESVTDRPTKAHEYLFLMAKAERYYYNHEAIKEPLSTDPRENYPARARITGRGTQGSAVARGNDRDKSGGFPVNGGRNKRSVWTVPTQPFPEAHFATFPEVLIEPCILAGCPEGGTVLDPFAGAGTTTLVALKYNRNAISIELNQDYCRMIERRVVAYTPSCIDDAEEDLEDPGQ